MSLARLFLAGVSLCLCIESYADQATEQLATLWLSYPGPSGGLNYARSEGAINTREHLLSKLGVAAQDPASFEAFRRAYYWAVGIPLGGGIDVTEPGLSDRDASLNFAASFIGGNKPEQLQAFKNAFYDQVGALAISDPVKLKAEANKIRDNLLADFRAGRPFTMSPPGNLEKEIAAWAGRSGNLFGGGLSAEYAAWAAPKIATVDKQGEGRDKLHAFRELMNFLCSKPAAGGADQCKEKKPDDLMAKGLEVLKAPAALPRILEARKAYWDWLLAQDPQSLTPDVLHAKALVLLIDAKSANVRGTPIGTPATTGATGKGG